MKRALLLYLLFTLSICCSAQTDHVYFDKIGIQEGLPESAVRNIVEDDQGYIWIATQNGLVKYDGYNYKVYNLGSPVKNLSSFTNVRSIIADRAHHTIWVSADGNGLFRYSKNTDSFEQFAPPLMKEYPYLNLKAVDAGGNVWGTKFIGEPKCFRLDAKSGKYDFFGNKEKGINQIKTSYFGNVTVTRNGVLLFTDNGFYRYNGPGEPFTGYLTTPDTAKTIALNPTYEPKSQPGLIWANTFHGNNINLSISCIDLKTGKIIKQYRPSKMPDSLADARIDDIYEDKKQRLWFASVSGLSRLDRKTNKFTNYPLTDTAIKNLKHMAETADGKLWLISGAGLVYFDPETGNYHYYKKNAGNPGGLPASIILSAMVDHTNTLWAGALPAGVVKINKLRSAFVTFQLPNTASPPVSLRPIAAGLNHTWMLTSAGIYSWQPETRQFSKIFSPLPGQSIINAAADGEIVYMGTNTGFVVYNVATGRKETYRNDLKDLNSIPQNVVPLIFKDHEGIIWLAMGNDQGICSFDPKTKKFRRYPFHSNFAKLTNVNDGSLDDGRVIAIYEDRQNTLWVGTNAGSVNKYDRKTGKFFSYYNKINEKMSCVSDIYESRDGRFWVGTYQTGLFEFDRNKGVYTRHIDEQAGLLLNSVDNIRGDTAGNIWVAGQRGLTRLNIHSNKLRTFKTNDILPGKQLFSLSPISLANGRFVVTLNDGMAAFDPKSLEDDINTPVVHLENISYNQPGANDSLATKKLTYGLKELQLAHDQNSVQFNYIGLYYEDPANTTYAYMLEGFDKQWVKAGPSRSVTYNNLPPGTYTFRIKAANSSGVWSAPVTGLTLVISPPWWSTWWAWVLYILLLAGAIYIYINYRQRHLKMENQLLEEKVEERTNELQGANHELHEQQEEIRTQRDELAATLGELQSTQQQLIQSEKLASLGELTAGIAHEIQNPLNFVNNFAEVSAELAVEMKQELRSGSKKEAAALADDIILNLEKIVLHGKRADAIVKNMLQHSRKNTGEKQPADINALADEYLRLSYHGIRAKEKNFNSEMVLDLDPDLPKIAVIQQDLGRVLLNLFNNAFYAVQQKAAAGNKTFRPLVEVTTRLFTPPKGPGEVRIYVKDNGTGIPDAIKEKIMQPFFTTKPTGEGTGLGLSLSYDIVVKSHGGKMDMSSKEGEYTEFIIQLPVQFT